MTRGQTLLCVLASAIWLPAAAQKLPNNYMMLTYTSVPVEQRSAYEAFIRDHGDKVMKAALDSGHIRGRLTLRLTPPFLNTESYQYVTVWYYDKMPTMDESATAAWDAAAKKAGFAAYSDYLAKMRSHGSKIVKQEVRRGEMRLGNAKVGEFVRTMAYKVDSGDMNEFIRRFETEALPLAKDAMATVPSIRGVMLSRRLLPNGTESEANAFYSVVVSSSEAMVTNPAPVTAERFKKVFPNGSFAEYVSKNGQWSKRAPLVFTRTMRIIAAVGSPAEPLPTN